MGTLDQMEHLDLEVCLALVGSWGSLVFEDLLEMWETQGSGDLIRRYLCME